MTLFRQKSFDFPPESKTWLSTKLSIKDNYTNRFSVYFNFKKFLNDLFRSTENLDRLFMYFGSVVDFDGNQYPNVLYLICSFRFRRLATKME